MTSNASTGAKLLIPILLVESTRNTVVVVPSLLTLISMFDPLVW